MVDSSKVVLRVALPSSVSGPRSREPPRNGRMQRVSGRVGERSIACAQQVSCAQGSWRAFEASGRTDSQVAHILGGTHREMRNASAEFGPCSTDVDQ